MSKSKLQQYVDDLAAGRIKPTLPDDPVGDAARAAHEAAQRANTRDFLAGCGAPADSIERVLAGLEVSDRFPAVAAVRKWANSAACHLLMCGGVGTGKSTAAVEALTLARKPCWFYDGTGQVISSWQYDRRAFWTDSVQLARFAPWSDEGKADWTRATRAPWLVIDDLGVEPLTEHFVADLTALFCDRHVAGLRTIMTTNAHWKAFQGRYGPRLWSRLKERGVVEFAGSEDQRIPWGES